MAKKKDTKASLKMLTTESAIDAAIKATGAKYNNAVVSEQVRYTFVPSGLSQFDKAFGGIPLGTLMEIFGPEEAGKTTLALTFANAMQMAFPKKRVLYIDYEDVLDLDYASHICDVSEKRFIMAQPECLEDGWDMMETLVRQVPISYIVVDSIAAMVPKAELEGDMSKMHPGLTARLVGQALRKNMGLIRRKQISMLAINQLREKIGVMFGSPETTPGGRPIPFRAAIRARLSKKKADAAGFPDSELCSLRIKKNKITGRKPELNWLITPFVGIEKADELLRTAMDYQIVQKCEKTKTRKGGLYYKGNYVARTPQEFCQIALSTPESIAQLQKAVDEA